ncbi:E3 ubiquitin-protein ligase RNF43 isoform X1 [Tachysurus ichikawai]
MRLAAQRLAGLWPWLFTATLQVALGHAGLEVAATRALIKVTLLNPKAIPFTLEGVFAGSSSGFAEGHFRDISRSAKCFAEGLWLSPCPLSSSNISILGSLVLRPYLEKARCLGRLHIRPTIVKQGHRSAFWDSFELEGKGSCWLSMGGERGDDKRANLRFCPPHLLKLIPLLAQLKEAKTFKKGSRSHESFF